MLGHEQFEDGTAIMSVMRGSAMVDTGRVVASDVGGSFERGDIVSVVVRGQTIKFEKNGQPVGPDISLSGRVCRLFRWSGLFIFFFELRRPVV